jgi:ABC-type glycerol-3-phosphate transport system permease component
MHKRTRRGTLFDHLILVGIALFVIIPIWGMLRISLDGSIKGAPTDFALLPVEFTLSVYEKVITKPAQSLSILGVARNSLIVSTGAATLSIVFGASMAYAFARFRFPGRQSGLFALLLGALLPPVALMTPLYIILSSIGIRTSLLGLIVVYTAFSMPFCVWNMRTAFQAVSKELEEAAFIDGATPFKAFWWVTLPIAVPSIAVAALVAFLAGYTEFAIGWLFIENSANVTLAMSVWGMMGRATWSELAALSILMSFPVVIIFIGLQKVLVDRLLLGTTNA